MSEPFNSEEEKKGAPNSRLTLEEEQEIVERHIQQAIKALKKIYANLGVYILQCSNSKCLKYMQLTHQKCLGCNATNLYYDQNLKVAERLQN